MYCMQATINLTCFVSCSETANTLLIGDQIIAINDINVETMEEQEKSLSKLQKNEVWCAAHLAVVFMQCWM